MPVPKSLADLPKPKPRNDAYTVMLTVSLLAMIGACVMLFYDLKTYPTIKPAGTDVLPVQKQSSGEPQP